MLYLLLCVTNLCHCYPQCLDVLVEVCQDISEERRTKGGLERVVQTTLLGAVLPAMLTVLSDKELKLYCIADSHLSQLHQLAQLTSEVIFIVMVVSLLCVLCVWCVCTHPQLKYIWIVIKMLGIVPVPWYQRKYHYLKW